MSYNISKDPLFVLICFLTTDPYYHVPNVIIPTLIDTVFTGPWLVWVQWVQLHPQIFRGTDFRPADFEKM